LSLLSGRSRFLDRFGGIVVSSEQQRIERIIATARSFLAITSLVAVWLDPSQPPQYATVGYGLMGLYVLHSVTIQVLVLVRDRSTPAFRFTIHAVDTIWPTLISMVTTGPNSPFFLFNVFVLSAAAYRWGLRETLATAGAAIALSSSQSLFAPSSPTAMSFYIVEDFEFNRILMRGLNLLILGFLFGYLGEQEKLLRAEASATARITSRVQAAVSLRAALKYVLNELCRLFHSPHALVLLNEVSTGRTYLWEARPTDKDEEVSLTSRELHGEERTNYVFDSPGQAWHADLYKAPGKERSVDLFALDETGTRLRHPKWTPPAPFLAAYPFHRALGASLAYGQEWSGYMFLIDPKPISSRHVTVGFLLGLSRYVGPALYNVYLTGRLRSRAGAVERARVARELHDGVIQSLISLEMQMDVLRRYPEVTSTQVAAEIERIQHLLHQEVLNVRELMQQIAPVNIGPRQLLEFLAYTVDKFRRDTGISATFTSPLAEAALPPRVCTEVARILQEALVNIRKHSGARNVLVRFESSDRNWILIVDDDGRGFDFSGHLAQDDLDNSRRGPMVIKERVRSIDGELTIDSVPNGGARLEISIPKKPYG
jgi:signal transduction histidine kinase